MTFIHFILAICKKYSNETLSIGDYKSNSCYKDYMKDMTFIPFILAICRKYSNEILRNGDYT